MVELDLEKELFIPEPECDCYTCVHSNWTYGGTYFPEIHENTPLDSPFKVESEGVPNGSEDFFQYLLMLGIDDDTDEGEQKDLPVTTRKRFLATTQTLSIDDFNYPTMNDVDPFWNDDSERLAIERANKRLRQLE